MEQPGSFNGTFELNRRKIDYRVAWFKEYFNIFDEISADWISSAHNNHRCDFD